MAPVAVNVGNPRNMQSGRIPHVLGDPNQSIEREKAWRRRIVTAALQTLCRPVERPTIFEDAGLVAA